MQNSVEDKNIISAGVLRRIEEFSGSIIVVKFGGNVMIDQDLMNSFAQDVLTLYNAGIKPVIVHGGGPHINETLEKMNIVPEFKSGFRVTDEETLDVVRMVLTGKVGKSLVADLNHQSRRSIGISGEDANLIQAQRKYAQGSLLDLGYVGEITAINPQIVIDLVNLGYIPVVSSLGIDPDSKQVYNINADTAAGALASYIGAAKLIVLTNVKGIYASWSDENSLISHVTTSEVEKLLPTLVTGMIPKMKACYDAVNSGVKVAHIIDGRRKHSIIQEVFGENSGGTLITS